MTPDKNSLFTSQQPRLRALAYRLLGSRHDAEDVLQEAWLRWHKVDHTIACDQAYLRQIVINLSMDTLRQRQKLHYTGPWLPEPDFDDQYSNLIADSEFADNNPEQQEHQHQQVSLAFLHMLEQLNPVERAVFVLREAFDDDFADIGAFLEKSSDNCRQIYSRSRRKLQQSPASQESNSERHQQLLMTFLWACQQGDVQMLQQQLAADAVLYSDGGGKVKAALRPIYGASKTIRLMLALARKQPEGLEWQIQTLNGRMAVVASLAGKIQSVLSLCVSERGIEEVYLLLNPEKLGVAT